MFSFQICCKKPFDISKCGLIQTFELDFNSYFKGSSMRTFTLYVNMKLLKKVDFGNEKVPFPGFSIKYSCFNTVFLWPKKPC